MLVPQGHRQVSGREAGQQQRCPPQVQQDRLQGGLHVVSGLHFFVLRKTKLHSAVTLKSPNMGGLLPLFLVAQ